MFALFAQASQPSEVSWVMQYVDITTVGGAVVLLLAVLAAKYGRSLLSIIRK